MQVMSVKDERHQRREPSSLPRGPRYQPPEHVEAVPFATLLAAGGRDALEPKQMDFLQAVTKSDDGGGRVFVAGDVKLLKGRCIAVIGAQGK